MSDMPMQLCFTILSIFEAFLYHRKAYYFSISILEHSSGNKAGFYLSLIVNLLLVLALLSAKLPVLFLFLVIFLFILLEYLVFFKGKMVTFLFASGTFIFHIMNLHTMFFGLLSIMFDRQTTQDFYESGLNPLLVFVVLLSLIISLEIFQKLVDRKVIMLLIKNISQLYFVTTSLMIINIYLCMLGACYSIEPYCNRLFSMFLFFTSLLLFGAFYTAFNHAVRMSLLIEYEIKSKNLEQQLVQSNENISQLESYVYLDPLTGISNRRYGLKKLNHMLGERKPFSICFIDLDGLKYVNDSFGHGEGDKYILCVIKALTLVFRRTDLCRMGGDEFMLILQETGKSEIEIRLAEAMKQMSQVSSQLHFSFTPSVSFGIVEVEADTIFSSTELLEMADRKMYEQKQGKKVTRVK